MHPDQHASINIIFIENEADCYQELHGYSINVTVSCTTAAPDPARDYWSEPVRNIIQRCASFTKKIISELSLKCNLMITECQMVLCNRGDVVTLQKLEEVSQQV